MSPAELELIVKALLREGVPPGVLARAFHLDDDLCRKAQSQVRVERYGTDDLSEYMEQMQWDAVDEARQILARGSQSEKTRYISAILGKQMSVAARRTPETVRKAQDSLLEAMERMRTGDAEETYAESPFMAVARTTVDQAEGREADPAEAG